MTKLNADEEHDIARATAASVGKSVKVCAVGKGDPTAPQHRRQERSDEFGAPVADLTGRLRN